MPIIYSLNIVMAVALLFWPAWFSRRILSLPWINPFTITLFIGMPVQLFKLILGPLALIDGGLFDSGYQFALFMGNCQTATETVALIAFYHLFSILRIERYLPLRNTRLNGREIGRAKNIMLVLFAIAYLFLTTGDYGLVGWLSNPREGYQLHRTGSGQWYALATTFLGVAFLLSFLSRPTPKRALWIVVRYLAISYFLGSKGFMLAIFTSGVIYLWFLRWGMLKRVLIIGTPLVLTLMIINLFLAVSDGFGITSIVEYFDYYRNAADYYRSYLAGQINLFHGEVWLTSFWGYVPRAVLPDKPVVYGLLLVNEIFFPGQAELTNTPAFGGAVEQFADFGVVGVFAFSAVSGQAILTAAMSYLTFRRPGVHLERITVGVIFIFLVQYTPLFGAYFPGGLYACLCLFVIAVIGACKRRRWPKNRPASLSPHCPTRLIPSMKTDNNQRGDTKGNRRDDRKI